MAAIVGGDDVAAGRRAVARHGTMGLLIAVHEVAMRAHHSAGLGWTIIGSIATPILLGVTAALLTHHRTTFVPLARVLGRRWTNLVIVAATLLLLQLGAANEFVAVSLTLLVIRRVSVKTRCSTRC